jgi:hypothetical protein
MAGIAGRTTAKDRTAIVRREKRATAEILSFNSVETRTGKTPKNTATA